MPTANLPAVVLAPKDIGALQLDNAILVHHPAALHAAEEAADVRLIARAILADLIWI